MFSVPTRNGQAALVAGTIIACLTLTLATAAPASAQLGFLKKVVPGASSSKTNNDSGGEPAPMQMADPTPVAPLHDLGVDAVAIVEDAAGIDSVQMMDYVYPDQVIELGATGKVVLSHLSGCLTETITGGTAHIAIGGTTVNGGQRGETRTPGCQAATPVILADASEAGATVNRVTPFSGENWSERTIKSDHPVFKWEKTDGQVTVSVIDLDQDGAPAVWQQESQAAWLAYPDGAPALTPGMPFKVEVRKGKKLVAAAVFSVDPYLDVADTLANRVVPVVAQ